MKHIHSLPLLLVLAAAPFAAGCGSADVQVPAVSATADVTAGAEGPSGDTYDDQDPSALTDFHSALDSHGRWVDDPTYGTVWVPNAAEVGQDFTPYSTSGHWAMDGDDYVWVSDYDWGWAPFHYGRWVAGDAGWMWIPGREYRPAWVNWGADSSYGYVGWYPMGPEYVWRGGVAVSYNYTMGPRWNYVGRGDVFSSNVGVHVLRGSAAASFSGNVHEFPSSGGGGGHGGGSRGPAPSQIGVSASAVPHPGPGSGPAKAQQFGHPSTATSMGGHAPTRTATPAGRGLAGGGSLPSTGSGAGVQRDPHTGLAGTTTTATTSGAGREPVQANPHGGMLPGGTTTTASSGGGREPVQANPHAGGLTPTGGASATAGTVPGQGTPPKKKNPNQDDNAGHPPVKGGKTPAKGHH